jgi:hypothetical protein
MGGDGMEGQEAAEVGVDGRIVNVLTPGGLLSIFIVMCLNELGGFVDDGYE